MTSGTVLKTRFSFVQNNRNYTKAMVTMMSWPAYNQPNGLIISHLVLLHTIEESGSAMGVVAPFNTVTIEVWQERHGSSIGSSHSSKNMHYRALLSVLAA